MAFLISRTSNSAILLFKLAALWLCSTVSYAADYSREQRWAEEITPGILVGEAIYLTQQNQHKFLTIYSPVKSASTGLIIVHGMGLHPDWGLISTLRQRLYDEGYTTLSIQMPVLNADATYQDYPAVFPEAVERLHLAVNYLRQQGYARIAIVSHSNGSRMSRVYMAQNPPAVSAWVALSLTQADTYTGVEAPVLDLYGDKDFSHVLQPAAQRKASFLHPASRQQVITNADHFFTHQEEAMVIAVKTFLEEIHWPTLRAFVEPIGKDPAPFCPSWD